MIKKWEINDIDEKLVEKVSKENNISILLAKILVNRGMNSKEEINKFLYPKIDDLYDPFLLPDIEKAIERIIIAKNNSEKVFIYGDYDTDGITSITVLYKFFKELGIDAYYYLPSRLDEGYGLNNEAIDKIKESGAKLLITVDCGISAHDEVEYAKSLGIDVIITDHHECPEVLPETIAVVDPKRQDSNYHFNGLAGVGVAFKLIHALSIKLNLDRKAYLKYLDIVCLGTVADIVPLVLENRIIVKYGLQLIKETKNIGLKALLKVSGYTKIDSSLISFGLAPRINACGRMGDADLALELFLTDSEERAIEIANSLNLINRERQEVEKSIFDEAVNIIEEKKLYNNDVIVLGKDGWHHGVIGIVSSKITEMYYKPSILVCFEGDVGKGSGRSIDGFDLHLALNNCKEYLVKFGGHEMAIGITINKDSFLKFSEDINDYAKKVIEIDKVPTIKADAYLDANMISFEKINELELLEPYGEANPMPTFIYKNLRVDAIRLLSNDKHLKLTLKDNGKLYDAIAFNMGNMRHSFNVGDKIDVLNYLEKNEFNGVCRIQLNIKDIKKSI